MPHFKCPKCGYIWTQYDLFCLPKKIRKKVLAGEGCPECKRREKNV